MGACVSVHVQAMDELDLSAFRYGGANFTGFRLVDRKKSQLLRNVHVAWRRLGAAYQRYLPADQMLEVTIATSSSSSHER